MWSFIILCSFFDFDVIANNWKFLRTAGGRGIFNLFIAPSFLVSCEMNETYKISMVLAFALCGIVFLLIELLCGGKDIEVKTTYIKKYIRTRRVKKTATGV